MLIKHNFVDLIPDGTNSQVVRPSNWNDTHSVMFTASDAGAGLTVSANALALAIPVTIASGGTGQTTSPTDGQLLIGDSSTGKFDLATLSPGNNVTITNAHGSILISASATASGFTSAGTGLTASGATVSLITPVTIVDGGTGQTASPTNGQLLIGDGGTKFDLATLSQGNNITITNGPGSILISASTASGFTSAGTGLTASGNTVSLIVPVTVADGGTGLTASPTDGQLLIGDSSTGKYDLATLSPGNNVTITNGHGSILISASGTGSGTVTSVALAMPANFTVSGSPITTSGTFTANYIIPPTPPQGRLTLQSGTPMMTTDVTGASTVYYDTYAGNQVPLYDGSKWNLLTIGSDEISMGLDAVTPHVAEQSLYDIFAVNNTGTLALAIGPAWVNSATITVTIATPAVVSWTAHGLPEGFPVVFSTTGALPTGITPGTIYFVGRAPGANSFNIATTVQNASTGTFINTTGSQSGTHTGTNNTTVRGAGAGTTQISLQNGIWTNTNTLTHAWGGASGTTDYGPISANQATYLGTFCASANGQTTMQFRPSAASGGSNNQLYLWNAYNRENMLTTVDDSGTTYTVGNKTAPINNNVANRVTYVDGLARSSYYGSVNYKLIALTNVFGFLFLARNQTDGGATDNNFVQNSSTGASNSIGGSLTFMPRLGLTYIQSMVTANGNVQLFPAEGGATGLVAM